MPTTLIKICGISTPAALDAAIGARADFIGLVFFPPSPRHVDTWGASALAARAGQRIGRVGLFVDADDGLLAEGVQAGRLDAIQLHGAETPQRCAEVKARFSLPVWKALPVAKAEDVARADGYQGAADLILFDAKTPSGSALPGGMGLTFDWSLLAHYRGALPWGLAGGLNPANVAEAIRQTAAPLVDTSSGVESAPGEKDVDKIVAFCKAARA
ncbi:phosphoribosylanthranilate isomerase [Erythrobacter sp. 3-20A1M]|uniref:phosphoribosylanthranilate isomerase n=1 Tax=Erythrobacter sp. 3-20A1M TaxID=2653850 RepID=UPI001BFC1085|nr:phosphoribosylanthranilate isomerase [Erythrobacter sp. 3-20A1M]QWC55850.1 phosphoribosylanthranilate isomerase [Erythrobacter sp. 3-20A1M]